MKRGPYLPRGRVREQVRTLVGDLEKVHRTLDSVVCNIRELTHIIDTVTDAIEDQCYKRSKYNAEKKIQTKHKLLARRRSEMDSREKRRELKMNRGSEDREVQKKHDKENRPRRLASKPEPAGTMSSEKVWRVNQDNRNHNSTSASGTDHVLTCRSDSNRNYAKCDDWGVFSVGYDEVHGDLFHLDGRSHDMGGKYCGIYEKEVDSQLESAFDTIEIEDIESCDEMEYDLDSYERYEADYDRDVNTWTSFALVHLEDESPGTISDGFLEFSFGTLRSGKSATSPTDTLNSPLDGLNDTLADEVLTTPDDTSVANTVDALNDNLPDVMETVNNAQKNDFRDATSIDNNTTSNLGGNLNCVEMRQEIIEQVDNR